MRGGQDWTETYGYNGNEKNGFPVMRFFGRVDQS
jgi:hypothetical protein